MKNAVQDGRYIDFAAPSGGVTAGLGYLIGNTFVIAATTAAQGEIFSGAVEGVYRLAKNGAGSVNFAVGANVSYDNTNKLCVAPATGAIPIGTAIATAANNATTVDVRLNGISTAAA